MPRPSVIRAALAGLLTLGFATAPALALSAPAPPAAAAPAEEPDPLVVHIDSITPVLPRSGDVEITGTVTNTSDETFTRVNLHPFSSQTPILDSTSLAASAAIDPTEYVGPRVTVPGTFATIDELAPGETASFTDSVPVELLGIPDQSGIYWMGVHALGDSSVPRDGVADGRARTFIPARPTGDQPQEVSVILSVRGRVWYDSDGRIGGTDRWARRLSEGGSLDGVLDMAESAGTTPYSWLADPAILIAIKRLAVGNPARSLVPDPSVPGQAPSPTESPSEGGAPETTTLTPPVAEPEPTPSEEEAALAVAATEWLGRFAVLVGTQPVLTLPFGDLDVSAAVRQSPERYPEALDRSAVVMTDLGLPFRLAVAPVSDVLSPEAISATPTDTLILLGDNAFAYPPSSPTSVVRLLGHKVVVTSTGAEAGGPGPTAATDPLALRQRLLSEAALRHTDGDTAPVVVTLPTVWRGEDAAAFFTDLDQPWLEVVPVGEVADDYARGMPAQSLAYTEADREEELGATNFAIARRTSERAALLEEVLALETTIETQIREEVLVTLSELHRQQPRLAARETEQVDDGLVADLARIEIRAPRAVTLSSDTGPFGATLVNGLDQPVVVTVRVTSDGDLTLTGDSERRLAPLARSVLRYEATTDQPGVHNVRLAVTSVDGVPLGSSDELPIRAARVSALIWVVMAAGALVLFGMIGYRLPGQVRARRAELAAAQHTGTEAPPADRTAVRTVDQPAPETS
ncbi:MAG TPA: DUF6049 family protein [Nocardioides sp.]|nr:DUF6049 family protein [Nocardioides sp.]